MRKYRSVLPLSLALSVFVGSCAGDKGGAFNLSDSAQGGSGGMAQGSESTGAAAAMNGGVGGSAGASGSGELPLANNLLEGAGGDSSSAVDVNANEETQVPVFPESRSCSEQSSIQCQGGSCCEQLVVYGGERLRLQEEGGPTTTISSVLMDRYEVTVGRFRRFVESYENWHREGNPTAGEAAHPNIVGSGWGTAPEWSLALPNSQFTLEGNLQCEPGLETWTNEPTYNENKPINCVSWYEAFAFCAWDGGRLPTDLEWFYAAAGGADGRTYPWGHEPPLSEPMLVYACLGAGPDGGASCTIDDISDVGSRSMGEGRFGQSDLLGSTSEWVLDWMATYPELVRDDYANVQAGTQRILRGGAWSEKVARELRSDSRNLFFEPNYRTSRTGVRCVHDYVEKELF